MPLLLFASLCGTQPKVATGAEFRLTNDPEDSTTPSVGVGPDGNVHVVWIGSRQLYYEKVSPTGQLLCAKTNLYNIFSPNWPRIAVDSKNHAHVVFGIFDSFVLYSQTMHLEIDEQGNKLYQKLIRMQPVLPEMEHQISSAGIAIDPTTDLPVVIGDVHIRFPGAIVTPDWPDPFRPWPTVPVLYPIPGVDYNLEWITAFKLAADGSVLTRTNFWSTNYFSDTPRFLADFPSVAVDSSGRVHSVWSYKDGIPQIGYSHWNTNTFWPLSTGPVGLTAPAIACSKGPPDYLHAVWNQNGAVLYRRLSTDGVAGEIMKLSGDKPTVMGLPAIAAGSDLVHVAWPDNRDGNREIYLRSLSLKTGEWRTEQRLTSDPGDSMSPSVSVLSTNLPAIVWSDNQYGNYELMQWTPKRLVLVTHGWDDGWDKDTMSTSWVVEMRDNIAKALVATSRVDLTSTAEYQDLTLEWTEDQVAGGETLAHKGAAVEWEVVAFNWRKRSHTDLTYLGRLGKRPWVSAFNARWLGEQLGLEIHRNEYASVHLISHSAGAWLIDGISDVIRQLDREQGKRTDIHLTFLDAYVPHHLWLLTPHPGFWHPDWLGDTADWAEHYVANGLFFTDYSLANAFNIDVTSVMPAGYKGGAADSHSWPIAWYLETTRNPKEPKYHQDIPLIDINLETCGWGFQRTVEYSGSHPDRKAYGGGDPRLDIGDGCKYKTSTKSAKQAVSRLAFKVDPSTIASSSPSVLSASDEHSITLTATDGDWCSLKMQLQGNDAYLRFDYEFLSASEGDFSVFFNDSLITTSQTLLSEAAANAEALTQAQPGQLQAALTQETSSAGLSNGKHSSGWLWLGSEEIPSLGELRFLFSSNSCSLRIGGIELCLIEDRSEATELPTIICAGDKVVVSDPGRNEAVVYQIGALGFSFWDDALAPEITYVLVGATTGRGLSDASGTVFSNGVTTVTYTITDSAGKTNACQFKVTVNELERPALQARFEANQLALSWPVDARDVVVESTQTLSPPIQWSTLTNTPVRIGDRQSLILSSPSKVMFYRLKAP